MHFEISLQSLWRGYKVRKEDQRRKVQEARKKIQVANAAATEEKQLGNRTTSALDYLLKYKQLAYILEAVMHLGMYNVPCCKQRNINVKVLNTKKHRTCA